MSIPQTVPLLIQRVRNSIKTFHATSIHAVLFKSGLLASTQVNNHLLSSYVRVRQIPSAHRVFDEMPQPNTVSWSSLLTGYTQQGKPAVTLQLYAAMLQRSASPNAFTHSAVISACSILGIRSIATQVHAHVETLGLQSNVVVASSLITMYGKCKCTDHSRKIFNLMTSKNLVTWTSLIAAYAHNSNGEEALQIFRILNSKAIPIRYNEFTLTCAIHICATTEATALGKSCHAAAIRNFHDTNDVVASSIVDMYAKLGSFESSHSAFKRISSPSTVSYTSIIVGAAKCGKGECALELFKTMVNEGIKPNELTMLGVLHGCSHAGLVEEGVSHLRTMHETYGVVGGERHYSCVVDMLGRAGRVEEAYELAKCVGRKGRDQRGSMWEALLSACRLHGRIDIACEASKRVVKTDNKVGAAFATLSNAFAEVGDWVGSNRLRLEMVDSNVCKEAACSWASHL